MSNWRLDKPANEALFSTSRLLPLKYSKASRDSETKGELEISAIKLL
jgi:hypothetical protein